MSVEITHYCDVCAVVIPGGTERGQLEVDRILPEGHSEVLTEFADLCPACLMAVHTAVKQAVGKRSIPDEYLEEAENENEETRAVDQERADELDEMYDEDGDRIDSDVL